LGELYLYEYTSSTPFANATVAWHGYGPGVFLVRNATTRYYWLTLKRGGEESIPIPSGAGLPAAAASATSTLVASAFPTSLSRTAGLSANPATAGTASTTVTPSGGTGPYTYAWTWPSGGAGIAANSPTDATTFFVGTHLLDGTTLTGTARCTVTDALTATASVDVPVQLHFPSIA
jgi:hypothetical protein